MMLEYEWGNPAAAAAAMMLFGEDGGQERHHQVLDGHYGHHGGLAADMFSQHHNHHHHHHQQQQQQQSLTGLFSDGMPASYGLGLPPVSARIGLNLGVRTYFSSGSPEQDILVGRPACRRRTRTARCQAEGCGADLTHAKHYHRRHKVCEFHSKASIVIAAGLSQRFCQQCSRFHVLSEFDQGKRSCRKRLADHNKRRRKSQDLTTPATTEAIAVTTTTNSGGAASSSPEKVLFTATATSSTEPSSSVTRVSSPAPAPAALPPPAAPRMGLGMSGSSSTSGTSPPSVCFHSGLGDFRGHDHRFTGWEEAEDGNSMRGLFQTK